eukprot:COSAG05_NODE_749_length_7548_cov_9.496442_3_plen_33_part_00
MERRYYGKFEGYIGSFGSLKEFYGGLEPYVLA